MQDDGGHSSQKSNPLFLNTSKSRFPPEFVTSARSGRSCKVGQQRFGVMRFGQTLTISSIARRRVDHRCSLASPEALCNDRALRRCSPDSLYAPMFRPRSQKSVVAKIESRITNRLQQHLILHERKWGGGLALLGRHRGILRDCFRLKARIPTCSIADSRSDAQTALPQNSPSRGQIGSKCKRARRVQLGDRRPRYPWNAAPSHSQGMLG